MSTLYEQNIYGVRVNPQTVFDLTKSYHGIAIQYNHHIIGRIQNWNPTFASREGIHIYELNAKTWGRPIDIVMGRESGRQIQCTRVEVWHGETELVFAEGVDPAFNAFGMGNNSKIEWRDLCEQVRPFVVSECWNRGNQGYRNWDYRGCWFTSKSLDDMSAEGDAVVRANVEMMYVIRHLDSAPIQEPILKQQPKPYPSTGVGDTEEG